MSEAQMLAEAEELKENEEPPQVALSTETIFAPRTKDMEEGFYLPTGGITVLVDSDEDLMGLAPSAGEVCIPLGLPFSASSKYHRTVMLIS